MIRLNGGREIPCSRSIGATIAGARPTALIARIWVGVMLLSARLPSCMERWMEDSRSAGSARSVPSLTITEPSALPPDTDATCDSFAFSPTGTIATSGLSGRAPSSVR